MITRRTVLAAGLGAAAVASSVPSGNTQTQTAQRTFVLVHGGWHGGWCWRRVADLLRRQGHTVFTPTLTGLGERSHLMSRDINLDTHITDVVNLFKWEDLNDAVLVGHSYAGWVISGVVEQCRQPIRLTGARDRVAKKTYIRAASHPNPIFDKYLGICKADRTWR